MLPTETDLNTLPVVSNLPEKVLPISAAVQSKFKGGKLLFIAFVILMMVETCLFLICILIECFRT
jgi:hypothetical protein